MDAQAVIAALRDRARKYVSLDTPEDADLGDMAIDIATGFLPVVGTAQAGRDFERARREGDKLGMGLSSLAAIPVVGGVAKAANKARKGGQAGEEAVKVLRGPRAEALETARQNAVKMLGLPENNTAMDRARALGFVDSYHGTNRPVDQIDMGMAGAQTGNPNAHMGFFSTPNTAEASRYAVDFGGAQGGNVMPLMVRRGKEYPISYKEMNDISMGLFTAPGSTPKDRYLSASQWAREKRAGLLADGYDTAVFRNGKPVEEIIALKPEVVRSRFAAFDPAKVKDNDLLGRADPRLLAAIAAGGLGTAAAVSALRNRNKEEEKAAP
jgi:hypothetical protein